MGSGQASTGRQARAVALIIAATGLFWAGAIWAGDRFGWPTRTRALLDLIALAGFGFALINLVRIWRGRDKDESGGRPGKG